MVKLKLSERDSKRFIEVLENPPAPNAKLMRAAKLHNDSIEPLDVKIPRNEGSNLTPRRKDKLRGGDKGTP